MFSMIVIWLWESVPRYLYIVYSFALQKKVSNLLVATLHAVLLLLLLLFSSCCTCKWFFIFFMNCKCLSVSAVDVSFFQYLTWYTTSLTYKGSSPHLSIHPLAHSHHPHRDHLDAHVYLFTFNKLNIIQKNACACCYISCVVSVWYVLKKLCSKSYSLKNQVCCNTRSCIDYYISQVHTYIYLTRRLVVTFFPAKSHAMQEEGINARVIYIVE